MLKQIVVDTKEGKKRMVVHDFKRVFEWKNNHLSFSFPEKLNG